MSSRNAARRGASLGGKPHSVDDAVLTPEMLALLKALGVVLSDEHGMMQELALARAEINGGLVLLEGTRHAPKEAETQLQPVDSGLFVYSAESDSVIPFRQAAAFTGPKKAQQALNDIFAKAYYGCKVWEEQLTAKPPDGAGFLLYIDPNGKEVFFPLSWCFSKRPPAFFLATTRSEQEVGTAFSYVNVYTSLAATENTALVPAYFRIYSDESGKSDIAQPAQLVPFADPRVTLSPETVDSTTPKLTTTVSSLTTEGDIPDSYGLEKLVPALVGVITLKSGQRIGRDESKWRLVEVGMGCRLPPSFVPVTV